MIQVAIGRMVNSAMIFFCSFFYAKERTKERHQQHQPQISFSRKAVLQGRKFTVRAVGDVDAS